MNKNQISIIHIVLLISIFITLSGATFSAYGLTIDIDTNSVNSDVNESRFPIGIIANGDSLSIRVNRPASGDGLYIKTVFLDSNNNQKFEDKEILYNHLSTKNNEITEVVPTEEHYFPRTIKVRVVLSSEITYETSIIVVARRNHPAPILLSGFEKDIEDARESIQVKKGERYLIQFAEIPTEDDKRELLNIGIKFIEYVPIKSWYVRIEENHSFNIDTKVAGGIVRVVAAETVKKVSTMLAHQIESSGDSMVSIIVHGFGDITKHEKRQILDHLSNFNIDRFADSFWSATIPATEVNKIAEFSGVQFIEHHSNKIQFHSLAANLDHNITALQNNPHNLTGAGINVAVFDSGWIDSTHPDLVDRVYFDEDLLDINGNPIGDSTAVAGHATRMAGVIGSSGINNPLAIGAATDAVLISYRAAYNYQNTHSMIAEQSQIYDWRIANHAYGSGEPCGHVTDPDCINNPIWSTYIQHAREADTWAFESDVISVYSAGNDGLSKMGTQQNGWENENWSTIHSGGIGKNSISVCAARYWPYGSISYSVRNDSSKGPASDGRIKPDVCANGDINTFNGQNLTTTPGGGYALTQATSPASAQTSGVVALLEERYKQLYGADMHIPPDLAKLLLVQTAVDMVDDNTMRWYNQIVDSNTSPGPDYTTGWGFFDAQAAIELLDQTSNMVNADIQHGESLNFHVTVPSGEQLKLTAGWVDPPGAVGSTFSLINDLDIEAQDFDSGEIFYPWVLDGNQPLLPAVAGINYVDNIEQVQTPIDVQSERTYIVRIKGSSVPHGPQSFHLVSNYPIRSWDFDIYNEGQHLNVKNPVSNKTYLVSAFVLNSDFDDPISEEVSFRIKITAPIQSNGLPINLREIINPFYVKVWRGDQTTDAYDINDYDVSFTDSHNAVIEFSKSMTIFDQDVFAPRLFFGAAASICSAVISLNSDEIENPGSTNQFIGHELSRENNHEMILSSTIDCD